MNNDEEMDPEELREAEALAQALDRGTGGPDLPEDALEAAALLRYSRDGGALAPAREDAILDEVLAAGERAHARKPERERSVPWWRLLFGFAGVAAIAVLVLLVLDIDEAPRGAALLPAPSAGLIEAQLARLEDPRADERFEREMREYRGEVYAAISARYGAESDR
jgi:hypothetical protein